MFMTMNHYLGFNTTIIIKRSWTGKSPFSFFYNKEKIYTKTIIFNLLILLCTIESKSENLSENYNFFG